MRLVHWLEQFVARYRHMALPRRSKRVRRAHRTRRPMHTATEQLEDRTLLTNFIVTTLDDEAFSGGTDATEGADGNGLSLREAIGLANGNGGGVGQGEDDGDTITFAVSGTIDISGLGQLFITDDVTIDGDNGSDGTRNITIDGMGGNLRIFNLQNDGSAGLNDLVVFEDLIIQGSNLNVGNGGGIATDGDLTLDNVQVTGNTIGGFATGGGGGAGIFAFNDAVVTIQNGSSIDNNTVTGNATAVGGGVLQFSGTSTNTIIDNSVVTNNTAANGGGIGILEGTATIQNGAMITSNDVSGNGGGVFNAASLMIDGSTVASNSADNGGGIYNDDGTLTVTGSTIGGTMVADGNTASGATSTDGGGGIYSTSNTVTINGGTSILNNVANGTAGSGGGIFMLDGTLDIQTLTTIDRNIANRAGGGLEIVDGMVTISGGTTNIRMNQALGNGGDFGTSNMGGNGGGLHITGAATVSFNNAIVSGNVAANEGGGLWNSASGNLDVIATQVNGNTAQGRGGGGIFNSSGGTLDLDSGAGPTTVSSNMATGVNGTGDGGGILSQGGPVTIDGAGNQVANLGNNSAARSGGAIAITGGTLMVSTVQMMSNSAGFRGGGIYIDNASATFGTATTVGMNTSAQQGGGIIIQNGGTATINSGATITGNEAMSMVGGGIFNFGGTLNVFGTVNNNEAAGSGGGIASQGGTTTLNGATISGNTAGFVGGGIQLEGGAMLGISNMTMITGNTATANGGGINIGNSSGITIDGSTIDGNIAGNGGDGNGGGISDYNQGSGTLSITNSMITNNQATTDGGGIVVGKDGNASTLSVSGSTISGNTALATIIGGNGGGIFIGSSTNSVSLETTTIDNNTASGNAVGRGGGGIFIDDNFSLSLPFSVNITNNMADATNGSGGGIFVDTGASLTATGTDILGNSAGRAGGGIENNSGTVQLNGTDLNNNSAGRNGGGLHASGSGNSGFIGGIVSGNTAGEEGGGIWNDSGTVTANIVNITNNVANAGNNSGNDQGGGGVFNVSGTLDIINGTQVTSNQAALNNGNGGGVMSLGGTVNISGGALVQNNNAAMDGGGIFSDGGLLTINNATVSGNTGSGFDVRNATTVTLTGLVLTGNTANSAISNATTVDLDTSIGPDVDALEINTPTVGGAGAFQLTRSGTPQDIVGFTDVTTLDVDFDGGNDSVNVAPHPTTVIDLNGGSPTSVSTGDSLTYLEPAGQSSTLTLNSGDAEGDAGTISATGGFANVLFDDFEGMTLNGSISIDGTSGDDLLVVTATSADAGTVQINGGPVINFTGLTDLTINGGDGDDVLIIDYTGGALAPTGGIFFNGQGQTGDGNSTAGTTSGDELQITGGTFTTVISNYDNANDGDISLDGSTITYTGLEPIDMTGSTATDIVLNLPDGFDNDATLRNNATGGVIEFISNTGTFEDTFFANPTGSLTINGGAMADTISVEGLDAAFDADLNIVATDTADSVTFQTNATALGNGSLDVMTTAITVNAAVSTDSAGSISLTASETIVVALLGGVSTENGDITLSANAGGGAVGDFTAITIDGNNVVTTGSGSITLTGVGASTGATSDNRGVYVLNGGAIGAIGTGTVEVNGTGGAGVDGNDGVAVNGSMITAAAGGGVTVTGTGKGSGQNNRGVVVTSGGTITDTAGGLVSVNGTGGDGTTFNYGVFVNNSTSSIASTVAGGDVTIIGTGGNGTGQLNTGVLVADDASITAADVVTVTGTGGDGGTNALYGVNVFLGGTISGTTTNVTGTAGNGSGEQNRGVFVISGSTIESTTGALTVIGTGGTGTILNEGVAVEIDRNGDGSGAVAAIRSAGGPISVTGLGGDGTSSVGVRVSADAAIENTAAGAVTVRGDVTSGSTPQGVLVSSNGVISTTDGDLTITTDYTTTADTSAEAPDLGADGIGLLSVTGTAQITAGGIGDVIVTTSDLNLESTANITADGDTVSLINSTAGRTIGLASGTGDFSITDAEADRIIADLLEIGSANAGNINVSNTFSPALVNNLRLVNDIANAAITSPTGLASTAITVGTLELVGNLAPGDGSPGGLIAIADVTLDSTITFIVDIDGPTVGTEYDSIDVVGTVSLGDATLEVDQLMSFDPAIGTEFMIVGNDGGDAVIGTFAGLAEGDVLASSTGTIYQISYVGGNGNDVVLTAITMATGILEVDNLGDQIDGDFSDGELTLREAIFLANLANDTNTITFDPDLFLGGPVDIDMEPQPSGNFRMKIFEDVDIVGPGADLLTIDANFLSQIFYIDSATVSISDLTLEEGFADGFDSGTFLETIIPVPVFLSNSERGGAIFNQEGDLTLTNVTVVDSESLDSGGGVYNLGTLTVIDSEFRTNFGGDDGGAIYNATTDFVTGVLDVSGSLFIANETFFDDGGAIHNSEGDITVDTSSFIDNFANFGGGGLSTDGGSAFVSNSTFGGNRAFVDGGAIYHSDSDLVLVNVTISGNQASVDGGGIYNDDGTLTIVNSTIFGNRADDDGDGGGIETGGGIWTFDDGNTFTTLVNTIVVGNMTGAVGSGVPDDVNEKDLEADSANNIIGDASTSGGLIDGVDGNIVGVFATDVIDTNLQNNGGPTSTHALFLGSPAIDAGDTDRATDDGTDMGTALVFDQRRTGFDRVIGNAVDIGAFELQTFAEVTIADMSATEGNSGTTAITFTLTRSANTIGTTTVDYAITNDTTETDDFNGSTLPSGTATFADGETTTTITVLVTGETTVELDETFFVTLSNPTAGSTITDDEATGTITNDDAAAISIDDVTQDEDAGTMTFTISLTNPVDTDVSVDFATATDTADGSDFTPGSGTATINAGMTSTTITVDITADNTVELDEQFFVNLSNLQDSGRDIMIADDQGVGTITNDDSAEFSIDDVSQDEDAGTMTFTISLTNPVDADVSVDYATATDTADGSDFTASSGTATITAGMTTTTITVDITADNVVELDEQFFVNLSNLQATGRDVTIGDDQGIGTITNDDAATISIDDVSQDEDAGTMTFTVTLSQEVDADVSIEYATTTNTASSSDFTDASGMATITAGTTSTTITIDITADNIVELDEQFFVNLTDVMASGRDVTFSDSQGVGTIQNDDAASVSIDDVSQDEDAGTMTFTVSLTQPVDVDVTVDFDSADGSATTANNDYAAATGTATFTAGTTSTTITVDITTDAIVELNEAFQVLLSNLQSTGRDVTFADSIGVGTIQNDDAAELSIDDVTQDEDAGTMTFTISLSNPVDTDVSIDFATAMDTADGSDFTNAFGTATITAGMTSTTITVDVTSENIVELNEQFFVDLSNLQASGRDVSIADDQGIGTITNDDTATVSIDDVSQDEDAGTMTFTVTLSAPVDTDVSVDFATTGNTAAVGDFVDTSGTVTVTAGMTSVTFTVDINADTTVELDEQFLVDLSNLNAGGRAVTLDDSQAIGTIQNDDSASFSIADVSVFERTASSQLVTLTVTLNNAIDVPVMVDFSTADGSATVADRDYIATNGTLDFSGIAGETRTLTVRVVGDINFEDDESFLVNLANVQAAGRDVTIADNSATGTIINDDLIAGLATFDDQPVMPSVINADFEIVISGNFDGTPTANEIQDDLFFWNSVTGANRIVFSDGTVQNSPIDPTTINGGDFTDVLMGNFDENGSSDLSFWNPATGNNRLVHFTGSTGSVATNFETNVVPSGVINGNDFPMAVVGNFDGAGPDDIFFWNPTSGRNRLVHFETVTAGSDTDLNNFQSNVVDITAINGNDFQEIYVGEFIDGGVDELLFLNLDTGANRRIEFSALTPGVTSGIGSIESGSIGSQAGFNDSANRVVQIVDLNGDGLDDVFLWDPTTGANRSALTDIRDQASPRFVDNVVDPSLINGNSFAKLERLVDAAFTPGEGEDLYFWDPITGNNRRIML